MLLGCGDELNRFIRAAESGCFRLTVGWVVSLCRIGWNRPLGNLLQNTTNAVGTNTGVPQVWEIPAAARNDQNYVVLNYSTWSDPFPNLWVSFRARSNTYDNILGSDLDNKVRRTGRPAAWRRYHMPHTPHPTPILQNNHVNDYGLTDWPRAETLRCSSTTSTAPSGTEILTAPCS